LIRSSYIENNYGGVFQSIITVIRPINCVEFGVLDGFSSILIGRTLKSLGKGHLFSYDLFEGYDYTSQKYETVLSTIKDMGLEKVVSLRKNDIVNATKDFVDDSIDFMHVDISNDGEKISQVFIDWDQKIKAGGIIIFEGGSPMRDKISWMTDYDKTKIYPEVKSNDILNNNYSYVIIHQFPSIVICSKNVDNVEGNMNEYGYITSEKKKEINSISKTELFNLIN